MPLQAITGIRSKVMKAFAAACIAIIAFTMVVIQFHLGAIDRGAQVEARDLARSVAYGTELSNEHVQQYVKGLHALYGRDTVFVDAQKKRLADAEIPLAETVCSAYVLAVESHISASRALSGIRANGRANTC